MSAVYEVKRDMFSSVVVLKSCGELSAEGEAALSAAVDPHDINFKPSSGPPTGL